MVRPSNVQPLWLVQIHPTTRLSQVAADGRVGLGLLALNGEPRGPQVIVCRYCCVVSGHRKPTVESWNLPAIQCWAGVLMTLYDIVIVEIILVVFINRRQKSSQYYFVLQS